MTVPSHVFLLVAVSFVCAGQIGDHFARRFAEEISGPTIFTCCGEGGKIIYPFNGGQATLAEEMHPTYT